MKQLEKIASNALASGAFLAGTAGLGYAMGRKNAKRKEKQRFGGLQAGSLLLPGGIPYQLGKHVGYEMNRGADEEKK